MDNSTTQVAEKNMRAKLVEMLEVDVLIEFKPGVKCITELHLRSLHPTVAVFFKVQTSAPHRFHVNPPSGDISPLSSAVLRVILRPQSHPPPVFPCSPTDRFLIKISTSFSGNSNDQLSQEIKLKVVYIGAFLLLHAASILADAAAVRQLIRRDKGVVARLSATEAVQLYSAAASLDDPALLNLLLDSGLQPNTDQQLQVVPAPGKINESLIQRRGEKESCSSNARTEKHFARSVDAVRDKGQQVEVEVPERGDMILTAARRGDLKRLESLLKSRQRGAGVPGIDQYGITPLHVAAIKGHCDVAELLMEAGAEVESQDIEGHTPLHLAVEGGNANIVELLLDMGANVNALSRRGATPLSIAQAMGHEGIAQLLLSRGSSPVCTATSCSSSSTSCRGG